MTYGHVRWLRASSAGESPARAGEFPAVTRPPSPSVVSDQEQRLGGRPIFAAFVTFSARRIARPPFLRSVWRHGGGCAMMRRMPSLWRLVPLLAAALVGCAPQAEQPAAPSLAQCRKDSLDTLYKGVFTYGTDQPVYPPWYMGDNPGNGE